MGSDGCVSGKPASPVKIQQLPFTAKVLFCCQAAVDEPKAIFFDLAGDFFRKGKAVFFTRCRFGWQALEMKSGADPNRETCGKSILQAHPAGRRGGNGQFGAVFSPRLGNLFRCEDPHRLTALHTVPYRNTPLFFMPGSLLVS